MQGRVRYWNEAGGYGFIRNEANDGWFFHRSAILGEPPARHDAVEFEIGDGRQPGELVAVRVKKYTSDLFTGKASA
jgi:cold shock CspA family protein